MSSPARQIATAARTRLAPLGTALDRARLTVVPAGRTQASRVPFIALVTALLLGGVIGLLMFNTSMQQAAFAETKLNDQATNLAAREQSLEMQLQTLSDPQVIAQRAEQQGMVIPGSPVILHVPSGRVDGVATPANRDNTPPLWPRDPKPRVKPRVIHVTAPATTQTTGPSTATGTTGKTGSTGKAAGGRAATTGSTPDGSGSTDRGSSN